VPDDATPIDDLYRRIVAITDELHAATSTTERERISAELDALRQRAAAAADLGRHPESLRRELEAARRRVAEIDALLIDESWSERHKRLWINDPSTYSADINRRLRAQYGDERATLVDRIDQIERHLAERYPDEPNDASNA